MLRPASFASFAALALVTLGFVACKDAVIAGSGGGGSSGGDCTYAGKSYNAGDAIPSGDGCNTCSCMADGQVACTAMGCGGGFPGDGCTYGGQFYKIGDSFPATDGCNSCTCEPGGSVACTLTDCVNTCTAAGGSCVALTPTACANGVWGDASAYTCGGGLGVGCCLPPTACANPCVTEGATKCEGAQLFGCVKAGGCLEWLAASGCGPNQTCDSTGSTCIDVTSTCTADAQCGCGCFCLNGACECTGALPSTCTADTDCGPACSGYRCTNGTCAQPVCTLGADQTCNDDLAMSALAGTCLPDGSCACKAGYTKQASGKCK